MTATKLETIFKRLTHILESVYKGDDQQSIREHIAADCIRHQMNAFCDHYDIPSGPKRFEQCFNKMTHTDFQSLETHCSYFATMMLAPIIVAKKITQNTLLQEKALAYIDKKLQADNFKWIKRYDSTRGASFKTYINHYINCRIIDFLRAKTEFEDISEQDYPSLYDQNNTDDADISLPQTDPAKLLDQEKLTIIVNGILQTKTESSEGNATGNMRYRLSNALQLTQREIAFLRALYHDDLNINQVRQLPGINLSVTQAYQLHNELIERITTAMRKSGILDELRDILSQKPEILEIFFGITPVKIGVDQILYLKKTDQPFTSCHAKRSNGTVAEGIIKESYTKLTKRFQSYFVPVNSLVSIAYNHIDEISKCILSPKKYCAKLMNFDGDFVIADRYFKKYFKK